MQKQWNTLAHYSIHVAYCACFCMILIFTATISTKELLLSHTAKTKEFVYENIYKYFLIKAYNPHHYAHVIHTELLHLFLVN